MNPSNYLMHPSASVHPDPAAVAAPSNNGNASASAILSYAAAAPSLQECSHLASVYASAVPPYAATAISYSYDDEDEELMPWERDGWRPLEKSGKQKTPNKIRGELQRYIDACKADGTMTQTRIMEKMGVNSNSFRKFMNPKTYKDQWSATQNGTYWAAARLMEQVKHEKEQAKKLAKTSGAKRKSDISENGAGKKTKTASDKPAVAVAAKSKAQLEMEAQQQIQRILAVEGVPDNLVYDSCPQLVKKIKDFLARPGVKKSSFCAALGDLNGNSLSRFLAGKGQDQCGNVTYKASYVFFEKERILEGKPKSAARRKNETEHPQGFSFVKARPQWYIVPRGW